jgi:hypothetical protein
MGDFASLPLVQQKAGTLLAAATARAGPRRNAHSRWGSSVAAAQAAEGDRIAPPIVRGVLSSPGQPLDPGTRRSLEPRFGRDFSHVRVHHDARAAASADAVSALAYTVGRDIVFGPGQYQPSTRRGRALLGHELTHVVQQAHVALTPDTAIRMGGVTDEAERQSSAIDRVPTLRRAPKPPTSWAGQFIADNYHATVLSGQNNETVGYGANIDLKFKAGPLVDAEEIGFVQVAQGVKDDAPNHKDWHDPAQNKTAASREIPAGKPGASSHVDQFPTETTPVYSTQAPPRQSGLTGGGLSGGKPNQNAHIGYHYKDAGGLKNDDATMHDEPELTSGDIYTPAVPDGEWSQTFETTAVALSGPQAGTYYGSVQWGWVKQVLDPLPHVLDLTLTSRNVPSPRFLDAAKAWNASVASGGTKSLELPDEQLHTVPKQTALWDSPARRRKVAALSEHTLLTRSRIPTGSPLSVEAWTFTKVIVTSGPHATKTGWVLESEIAAR